MSETINLSFNNSKITVTDRSKGRMKIAIKFSKEEAEAFKNFTKIKPPGLPDDLFYKQIFFAGCNAMTAQIEELIEQHRDKLDADMAAAEASTESPLSEDTEAEVTDGQSEE
jgi:hypothetical protein